MVIYQILETIGSGGYGTVWKVQEKESGRIKALKKVENVRRDSQTTQLVQREIQLLSQLPPSPYVIHADQCFYRSNENNGTAYIITPWYNGLSLLRKNNDQGPIREEALIPIILDVLQGLQHLHQYQVVHQDLKPANIICTQKRAVIIDLGLSELFSRTGSQQGYFHGSIGYCSPEQIRGNKLNGQSDIFNVGVIMYEILCRRHPFIISQDCTAVLQDILTRNPSSPIRYQVNPRLSSIIMHCLEKRMSERYLSAYEVWAELMEYQQQKNPSLPPNPMNQNI